jgi:hypothetical protein
MITTQTHHCCIKDIDELLMYVNDLEHSDDCKQFRKTLICVCGVTQIKRGLERYKKSGMDFAILGPINRQQGESNVTKK